MPNPETTSATPGPNKPPANRWRWVGTAFGLAIVVYFTAPIVSKILERSDGGGRKLQRNIRELKSGETNAVHLTTTRRTDDLLEQIRGMPEIEEIFMEEVDVTPAGMRHIGTLPNLKHIFGYTRIGGDEGFLELRNCRRLEVVVIFDHTITDDAVAELKRALPNAKRVIANHDENRAPNANGNRDSNAEPSTIAVDPDPN